MKVLKLGTNKYTPWILDCGICIHVLFIPRYRQLTIMVENVLDTIIYMVIEYCTFSFLNLSDNISISTTF